MKMTIAKKLGGGAAILLLPLIAVAWMNAHKLSEVREALIQITDWHEPVVATAAELEINSLEATRASLSYLRTSDPVHLEEIIKHDRDFQYHYEVLVNLCKRDSMRSKVSVSQASHAQLRATLNRVIDIHNRQSALKVEHMDRLKKIDGALTELQHRGDQTRSVDAGNKFIASKQLESNVNGVANCLSGYLRQRDFHFCDCIEENETGLRESYEELAKHLDSTAEQELAEEIQKDFKDIITLTHEIVDLEEQKTTGLRKSIVQSRALDSIFDDEVRKPAEELLAKSKRQALWIIDRAQLASIASSSFLLLLGGILATTLSLQIRRRIQSLRDGAMRFASGNPDYRVDDYGNDELSELAAAFNWMADARQTSERVLQQRTGELEVAKAAVREGQLLEQHAAVLARVNQQVTIRNMELDEFTYVASHDLQEPLRKLISFSKLLEMDTGGDLSESAKRDLEYITTAAHRMQSLVRDLLALSRVGRAAMKMQSVELRDCVDRAMAALSISLQERHAEVIIGQLPTVVGDRTLLTQLYQNLIGNALKFVSPGMIPRIELTCVNEDNDCVLGVRDNGIGIKAEYLEQIFAPFKRLHSRTQYDGTGVGLSICRKAVERHDGRIWVESEPGVGSHFKFIIPIHQEQNTWNEQRQGEPLFSS